VKSLDIIQWIRILFGNFSLCDSSILLHFGRAVSFLAFGFGEACAEENKHLINRMHFFLFWILLCPSASFDQSRLNHTTEAMNKWLIVMYLLPTLISEKSGIFESNWYGFLINTWFYQPRMDFIPNWPECAIIWGILFL